MSKEFILKKNILGGFDRQQVIDCLSQLQSKCTDRHTRAEIEKTNQQINDYLKKIDERNKRIKELETELRELKDFEKSPDNNILKNLKTADRIVECAKEKAAIHIKTANNSASENSEKFTQLLLRVDSLKAEISQIGKKADNISSKLSIIETDESKNTDEALTDTYQKTLIAETVQNEADDSYEQIKEIDDVVLIEEENIRGIELNSDNSIDNFFAELEKLTGSENFYDNGPSIDEPFDKSKKILPDTDEKKDAAFDDMLKNIFHESSDKQ